MQLDKYRVFPGRGGVINIFIILRDDIFRRNNSIKPEQKNLPFVIECHYSSIGVCDLANSHDMVFHYDFFMK